MSPIDEDAFWRTLTDCKASRYLTAGEVQFLLKYRGTVEAARAEHERRRAADDNLSQLLAAACSSAPPSEETLTRLLDRQPQSEAADNVVKAFVAAVRLLINRSAVRECLAAVRSIKPDRVHVQTAAAAAYLDYGRLKKVLRKLESKAYIDAIETDLKCCQKLVPALQSSRRLAGGGLDGESQQQAEEAKPTVRHKRHSLPLPSKADGSPPANDQVVQKLFPLQKLMHTHPACERLNEDPIFKNGHLEEKIKYLLDLAHKGRRSAEAAAASAEHPPTTSEAPPPLRRTVATQCERRAECRDAAVSTAIREVKVKARRRASEPTEAAELFGGCGRRHADDSGDDSGDGRRLNGFDDVIDGVQDLEEDDDDIAPLRAGAGDRHMETLRSALARTAAATSAAAAVGPCQPAAKVPSAKTEREMLLYIAREIQDEWTHVFRDLMDDAEVPLDDVQVLKAEIEENYEDAFLQACQCLERWRRAAGSFEVHRLRKVFESRHRKDLVNYMEARVTRASGVSVRGRRLY